MNLLFTQYKLQNASPEYVFEWLKNNVVEIHLIGDDRRDELEKSLYERENKLIHLGLALYGEVPEIGYELFKSSDPVLRRAALSGRSVKPIILGDSWVEKEDVLPVLLEEEKSLEKEPEEGTLFHALLENEFIPSDILESIYKKDGIFADVDEKIWVNLVAMTALNKRMATPYSSTWMDGYDEYLYNSVFASAWQLFENFPVNRHTATVLAYIGNRFVPYAPHDMDVMAVLKRWQSQDEKEDDTYGYARTALTRILSTYTDEFKGLVDSEDMASRKGFYSTVRNPKPEQLQEWFDRDSCDFLDAALYNDSIFSKDDTRSTLRSLCWNAPDTHSRMDYPNYFNAREEYFSSQHPEWFEDQWDGEVPFDEIDDPTVRLERRVEMLNGQVTQMHRALFRPNDDYSETAASMFDVISADQVTLAEFIKKVESKVPTFLTALFVGLIVGYFIASFRW